MLKRRLLGIIHAGHIVAPTAFPGVRGPHFVPHPYGKGGAENVEVLAGADGSNDLVIQILDGNYFGEHFRPERLGHMTIGTRDPHSRSVLVVTAGFPFVHDELAH